MERVNVFNIPTESDPDDPPGYLAGMARFGPSIGARLLGGSVYDLPPGESVCPYHYEYGNEEWLLVLDGRPTLRHALGRHEAEEDLEHVLERAVILAGDSPVLSAYEIDFGFSVN